MIKSDFESMFKTNDIMDIVDSFSPNEMDMLNNYDFFQFDDENSFRRYDDDINVDDLAAFLSNDFSTSGHFASSYNNSSSSEHDFVDVESLSPKPMIYKSESFENNKSQESVLILNGEKIELPLSPQSSFASDSDSVSSFVESNVMRHVSKGNNTTRIRPKTATIIKKIKDQPCMTKKIKNVSSTNSNSDNKISNIFSAKSVNNNCDDENWPFLFSLSKLPQSGPLMLTEEEKRTYRQENIEIPVELPLSKTQEKILKKIRRKIKNKISAQESRRKRKSYVDTLEKSFDCYKSENRELKKRVEDLEINNKNLLTQLQKCQNPQASNSINNNNTNHFGTTLMIIVLFFAVVLGIWPPLISKTRISSSTTTPTASNVSSSNENSSDSNSCENPVVLESNNLKPFVSFSTAKIANEVEFSSFDVSKLNSGHEGGQASIRNKMDLGVHHASSIGHSKTGSAVELTKVRPFLNNKNNQKIVTSTTAPSNNNSITNSSLTTPVLPKIITINSIDANNQRKTTSEYIYINDTNKDAQIVIVNLPKSSDSRTSALNMQLVTSNFHSTQNKTSLGSLTAIPVQTLTKTNSSTVLNSNMKRVIQSESLQPAAKYRLIQS